MTLLWYSWLMTLLGFIPYALICSDGRQRSWHCHLGSAQRHWTRINVHLWSILAVYDWERDGILVDEMIWRNGAYAKTDLHFDYRCFFSDTEDKYKMDPSWIKEGAVVINVVGGPSWRKCQVEDGNQNQPAKSWVWNSKQHICRESLNLPLGSKSPDLWMLNGMI